ncbi:MAG: FKBP-type peptidyl-prolyl cis-trans isomerase [Proteobacteria bacterium]|nr:FKBP-type peptidyl-prolyl cis-trans isomerase [Pseudomonadota bacterium]
MGARRGGPTFPTGGNRVWEPGQPRPRSPSLPRFLPLAAALISAALVSAAPLAASAQAPAAPAAASAGADFLAKTAKEPGVVTLPSGLEYKVVASGPAGGPSPKEGDVIKVHYEGKLVSGEVFDSSFARGKPVLMPLGDLVPAWMEAIPKMKVGDEWMLYVPPQLGYGERGAGPIPPNSVLIFRVKLLGMLSAD